MHYRSKANKTVECRAYERTFLELLEPYGKSIDDWLHLNLDKHNGIAVNITFIYPYKVYYNLQKEISSKTMDLSNSEKQVLDLLCKDRAVNDKYVTVLYSGKVPGPMYQIVIELGRIVEDGVVEF